jgi:hypothetical protein
MVGAGVGGGGAGGGEGEGPVLAAAVTCTVKAGRVAFLMPSLTAITMSA